MIPTIEQRKVFFAALAYLSGMFFKRRDVTWNRISAIRFFESIVCYNALEWVRVYLNHDVE